MSQTSRRVSRAAALSALALLLTAAGPAPAQGGPKKSADVVKAEAKAGKPAADGSRTVTIALTIEKGWHLYANPVGFEDLAPNQTTVTFTGANKPDDVKIDYPPGKSVKDKVLMAEYRTYEDKVTIKAKVGAGSGPLEVSLKVQACDERRCLAPSTLKLEVK